MALPFAGLGLPEQAMRWMVVFLTVLLNQRSNMWLVDSIKHVIVACAHEHLLHLVGAYGRTNQ